MLAHRHRVGRRRDAADRCPRTSRRRNRRRRHRHRRAGADRRRALGRAAAAATTAAGLLVDERQRHVDFGVLREVAGVGQVERAARAIETIVARAAGGLAALTTSRRKKSVASTRTRPSDSAATVNPHRIDFANESSTDFRSSGFLLLDRNDWLPCTSMTRGPTRWNWTMRLPPPPSRDRDRCRSSRGPPTARCRTGSRCRTAGSRGTSSPCAHPSTAGSSRRASSCPTCDRRRTAARPDAVAAAARAGALERRAGEQKSTDKQD